MSGTRIVCIVAAVAACAARAGCATSGGSPGGSAPSADERRAKIEELRERTLADLYAEKPETKAEIQSAVGYAIFDASQVTGDVRSALGGACHREWPYSRRT